MYVFKNLRSLCSDLGKHRKSMEQFSFSYNCIDFDCVIDIGVSPFALMIGALQYNFACVVKIQNGFRADIDDSAYYALCNLLNLSYKNGHFTSNIFLAEIDRHIPEKCNENLVSPVLISKFRADEFTKSEKEEGFVFCGWLTHDGKNNGHARNFEKTEKLLGKTVADYCRIHDISSK